MKLSAILAELSIAGDADAAGRAAEARAIRRDVVRRALAAHAPHPDRRGPRDDSTRRGGR